MAASKTPSKHVCVISDSTGTTAERVLNATLCQFTDVKVRVEVASNVKTRRQIRTAVENAKRHGGMIAYTLVDTSLRREIVSLANEAGVATVDLIGPLMIALSTFLTAEPVHKPGLYTHADEDHYTRLEAVSFTVRHDDGLSPRDAHLADIVIVGPSRTSKTPLSVYLAHTRGLKVANIPLVLNIPPLEELKGLAVRQTIGLTMRADVLSQVRSQRLKDMGNVQIEYAAQDFVEQELRYCHEIYRSRPVWPVVDVTGKSIEEIASEVCSLTVDSPEYKLDRKSEE